MKDGKLPFIIRSAAILSLSAADLFAVARINAVADIGFAGFGGRFGIILSSSCS